MTSGSWDAPRMDPPPPESGGRPRGRPKKSEAPRIDYSELDRLLVFGETVPTPNGNGTMVEYPSCRDLAARYGVANSLIAKYSKEHNCMRRRAAGELRVQDKADKQFIEMRAKAHAVTREDSVRIIDGYLLGFERAVLEGRVRFDNPSDFNQMLRLREFIMGGADSRHEVHATLSLEELQTRYRHHLRAQDGISALERGEVTRDRPALPASGLASPAAAPCSVSEEGTAQYVPVRSEPALPYMERHSSEVCLTGMVPLRQEQENAPLFREDSEDEAND